MKHGFGMCLVARLMALQGLLSVLVGCGSGAGEALPTTPPATRSYTITALNTAGDQATYAVDGAVVSQAAFLYGLNQDFQANGLTMSFQVKTALPGFVDVYLVTSRVVTTVVPRSGLGAKKHLEVFVQTYTSHGALTEWYDAHIFRTATSGLIYDDINTDPDPRVCLSGSPIDVMRGFGESAPLPEPFYGVLMP